MRIFNLKLSITIFIILLSLELIGISYITIWREWFWQSVGNKEYYKFLILIGNFTLIALFLAAVQGIRAYLESKIGLHFRRFLTRKTYRLVHKNAEGYSQRVQEDCRDYPTLFISIMRLLYTNSVLIIFYISLIVYQVGLGYLIIPIAYALLGTLCASKIARPLIKLNYDNQMKEALFRQALSKTGYGKVHRNNHEVFKATKYLNYFQVFYNQIGVIFPYLLLSFSYFNGHITLGVFMQLGAAMAHLGDSLGILINSFDSINKFLSCRTRLREIKVI